MNLSDKSPLVKGANGEKKPEGMEEVTGEQAAYRMMVAMERMADATEVQAILAEKAAVKAGIITEAERQYPDEAAEA